MSNIDHSCEQYETDTQGTQWYKSIWSSRTGLSGGQIIRWPEGQSSLLSTFEMTMKTTPKEAIYQGVWRGYGKLYNIKVENGYTTIIVKPGENVKQRSLETKKKFAGQKETNKTPNGKNIQLMFK